MAQETPDFDSTVVKAAYEMDKALKKVMPASWHGHARLRIAEAELPEAQREFAEKLAAKALDSGTLSDAERAAELSIKKAKQRDL